MNTDWQDFAACGLDPDWTPELDGVKKPPEHVLQRLEAICRSCPVLAECAGFAIDNRLECCVVAGMWVPQRASQGKPLNVGYQHVVSLLSRKAAS